MSLRTAFEPNNFAIQLDALGHGYTALGSNRFRRVVAVCVVVRIEHLCHLTIGLAFIPHLFQTGPVERHPLHAFLCCCLSHCSPFAGHSSGIQGWVRAQPLMLSIRISRLLSPKMREL